MSSASIVESKNNVKRNIFGLYCVVILWPVEHQRNNVKRAYSVIAFHRLVVYVYKTGVCRALYAVAACVLQLFEQEFVNAQRLLSFVYDNAQMFIQLLPLFVFKFNVVDVVFCHNILVSQVISVSLSIPDRSQLQTRPLRFLVLARCKALRLPALARPKSLRIRRNSLQVLHIR